MDSMHASQGEPAHWEHPDNLAFQSLLLEMGGADVVKYIVLQSL